MSRGEGSQKATIWIGKALRFTLNATGNGNRSRRIDTVARRYNELVNVAMPEFSLNQWLAIMDANYDPPPHFDDTHVWVAVAIARGLGAKYDIDQADLARRLTQLLPQSCIAVAEAIDRFWAEADGVPFSSDTSATEALRHTGARISGET